MLRWSQFKNGQALRREGNKVEVLEGKFRRLKLFFEKLLSKIKNLHSEKKNIPFDFIGALYNASSVLQSLPYHFSFVVAMLVLLNETRSCR